MESATARAVATIGTLLPLRRRTFEKRLEVALQQAARNEGGFFIPHYHARCAIGPSLVINVDPTIEAVPDQVLQEMG